MSGTMNSVYVGGWEDERKGTVLRLDIFLCLFEIEWILLLTGRSERNSYLGETSRIKWISSSGYQICECNLTRLSLRPAHTLSPRFVNHQASPVIT
jgi:hypothetical protein